MIIVKITILKHKRTIYHDVKQFTIYANERYESRAHWVEETPNGSNAVKGACWSTLPGNV